MSVKFTDSAVAGMEQMAAPADREAVFAPLLKDVEAAAGDLAQLEQARNVVKLNRGGGLEMFLMRSGKLNALLATDPSLPGDLLVTSVYRAADAEAAGLETSR